MPFFPNAHLASFIVYWEILNTTHLIRHAFGQAKTFNGSGWDFLKPKVLLKCIEHPPFSKCPSQKCVQCIGKSQNLYQLLGMRLVMPRYLQQVISCDGKSQTLHIYLKIPCKMLTSLINHDAHFLTLKCLQHAIGHASSKHCKAFQTCVWESQHVQMAFVGIFSA